jgi:hypothetical protein
MDNWQKALDNWLTSTPKEWDMERVTKEGFMDTDKESGVKYPTYVDELSCEDCGASIGWESHGGTFVEFFADPSDRHYKCEDCHGEWLDLPEA